MKRINLVVLVGVFTAIVHASPRRAEAQPRGYYASPAPSVQLPGGFHNRAGRLALGFSIGLGGMHDDFGDIGCQDCDYQPLSFGGAGHIGGFLNPRMALMLELQFNTQQVSQGVFVEDDQFLTQSAAMIALQYWLMPQLWVKGGLGLANLRVDDAFFVEEIDNGTALMGAIGFEILSARYFSIDLEGRLLNGAYRGIDNNVTAGTIGIGVNWY